MAVALRSVGTATGGSGPQTAGAPAGTTTDDILIACVAVYGNSGATSSGGWDEVATVEVTASAAYLTVFAFRHVGGSPDYEFDAGGQPILVQVMAFSGADTGFATYDQVAGQANASSTTVTAPTITPSADGCMVALIAAAFNEPTVTVSGYSGTDPTFTEALDSQYDGGAPELTIAAATGVQATAAATGSRTATLTTACVNAGVLLSIAPPVAGGQPVRSMHQSRLRRQ